MSVAPEIARLAEAVLLIPAQHAASPADFPDRDAERALPVAPRARVLRSLAASPERWWGLVRFEPGRSVQVTVEECAAYRAWLVVLPPGDAGQSCDCDVATMIAGEATEGSQASAVLRPGPVRAHGERHDERHSLRGRGAGY